MTTTISNIGIEIKTIISKTKDISTEISQQEKIDLFLDNINKLKKNLDERVEKINHLEKLFTQITWLDVKNVEEEILLKEIIAKSKIYHTKAIKNVVFLKTKLWRKNICRTEILNYKDGLDDFEDTIYEVEEIFFSLRKDDEFNNLLNSL